MENKTQTAPVSDYVLKRQHYVYYSVLRSILAVLARDYDSILDVGSNSTDVISHLDMKVKVSVDLKKPLVKEGVTSVKSDWLKYKAPRKFGIVCCFQVLEHIPDESIHEFTQKLFDTGEVVLISVPYRWKKGRSPYHCQDPVDEEKLRSWTKRNALWSMIVKENPGPRRMIAVYHKNENSAFWDITRQIFDTTRYGLEERMLPNRKAGFLNGLLSAFRTSRKA